MSIYINSPGGDIIGLMAVYENMMYIKNDVSTMCIGQAASAAAVLLAAGTKGKRFALPNARILKQDLCRRASVGTGDRARRKLEVTGDAGL